MKTDKKTFSIKKKMYIFVVIVVIAVAFGISIISFFTGADQIDRYYKQNTADNARNFASMVDGDFLRELREAAKTDEFQALRETAEETDDEMLIEEYLRDHGLWDQYIQGCCNMICEEFKHSPVYRIGGDEFVAVLHGPDYENRKEKTDKLKEDYEKTSEQNDISPWLRYSAAVGMAEYSSKDYSAEFVFRQADKAMYENKALYKKRYGGELR